MLVDHADTGVDCIRRRVDGDLFVVDQDFALIRLVKPVENVH